MARLQSSGGCEPTRDLLFELALGSLTGAERSIALSHLEVCEACRRQLAELSGAADQLLLGAPEMEPPVGFEVRLIEQVASRSPRRTGDRRRGRLRKAALTLALLAGGGGLGAGVALAASSSQAASGPRAVRLAAFRVRGGGSGVAAIEAGRPSLLVMRVEGLTGTYWVSCVLSDGSRLATLGRFNLSGGSGHWSARIPALISSSKVRTAELLGPGGQVLARADFSR